ncbi:hypothetical protein MBLNU230_g0373t1 [Neophaeotheca triangularis]
MASSDEEEAISANLESSVDKEKQILADLKSFVDQQTHASTFACGGSLSLAVGKGGSPEDTDKDHNTKPVTIRFEDKHSANHVLRIPSPAKNDISDSETLITLLQVCEPATFGRGNENVLDEGYRKAGKMDSEAFDTNFSPYETGIVDQIAQLLLPNLRAKESLERSVRAELYKLNVYSGPDGRFKKHVDTPRSPEQFGSLVVCLPVEHKAAFYSDCEHEVLPVTSDHRVTLTYNLYATKGLGALAGSVSGLDASKFPVYQSMKQAITDPAFLPRGCKVGIFLKHAYAHTHPQVNLLPHSLKGVDMVIYQTARALGLETSVRPITEFGYGRYKYTAAGRDKVKDDVVAGDLYEDQAPSRYWAHDRLRSRDIVWLNARDKKNQELALAYTVYGNEMANLEVNYSAAALIIQVPSAVARGVLVEEEEEEEEEWDEGEDEDEDEDDY